MNYLFHPQENSSGYLGMSILRWTHTISPKQFPVPDNTVHTIDPYFGGGYAGWWGSAFYYNAAIYLSPTARLYNQTSVSSEEQQGNFDIQLQLGFAF
jgi:hypothetical protein